MTGRHLRPVARVASARLPSRLFLVLIPFLGGLLFATAVQEGDDPLIRTSGVDNAALYTAELDRVDRARLRVQEASREISTYTDQQLTGADARPGSEAARSRDEANLLADAAGQQAVRGPTFAVTLDDAPPDATGLFRPDELVVHQQDVQAVVNALWSGGAEAMTLMGHRIDSTTAVRCVGNTVLIGHRLYSPPYRIVAVGDPERLQAALDASEQVAIYREYVRQVGLGWQAGPAGVQVLPGVVDPVSLSYATVVAEDGGRRSAGE